jgi:hypothetical protein
VFAEIGANLMGGMAKGISGNASSPVAEATNVALAITKAMSSVLHGLGGKTAKNIKSADALTGPIGDLVSFLASITTALAQLGTSVPGLAAGWKANVTTIVGEAANLSKVVAAAINSAFPQTKGKAATKNAAAVAPTAGKAGAGVIAADTLTGPIGDLLSFFNNITASLTTLSTSTIPAMVASWPAQVTAVMATAVQLAGIIATAISAAFPTSADQDTVTAAATTSGPIGDLLSFFDTITTSLTTLSTSTLPTLAAGWQTGVKSVVDQVIAVANVVAAEINAAFSTAGSSQGVIDADTTSGPIGDVMSFLSSTISDLTTISGFDPSLLTGVAAIAGSICDAVVNIVAVINAKLGATSVSQAALNTLSSAATALSSLSSIQSTLGSLGGAGATPAAATAGASGGGAVTNNYNLTIYSQAQTEQIAQDFATLRAMAVSGT